MRELSRWDRLLLPKRAAVLPFPACRAGARTPQHPGRAPQGPPCRGEQGRAAERAKLGGSRGGSPRSAHHRLQHLPEPQALPWDVAAGFFSQRAAARSAPHCPHPQSVVEHQARAKRVQTGAQFWQILVLLVLFHGCGDQNMEVRRLAQSQHPSCRTSHRSHPVPVPFPTPVPIPLCSEVRSRHGTSPAGQ